MVGTAQKSPHTHKIAAPICWSEKGGKLTPRMWLYTEYHEVLVRMLIDMASTHMRPFVTSSAAICPVGASRIRNGGDEMNCSQNSTPTAKKLPCISQMCTA